GVPRHDLPGDRGPAGLSAEHGEDEAISGPERPQAPLAAAGEVRPCNNNSAMTTTFRCDDKERLVAYLYDEIGDTDRTAIERHLATCASCAGEIEGCARCASIWDAGNRRRRNWASA